MPKDVVIQLIYEVKHLVRDHDYHALSRIRELLKLGADPKKVVLGESAFEIIAENNKDGRYNAVVEEFEVFKKSSNREEDSIDEGMHLTKEEI